MLTFDLHYSILCVKAREYMEATKEIRHFIKQNIHQLCIDYIAVSKAGCRKDVPTFDELYNLSKTT